jgi:protein phosphatase
MIEHFGATEQGPVRTNNEDFILHYSPEEAEARLAKGHLFVVADGVGGNLSGEVASREASKTLISTYCASPKRWGKALQDAFQAANLHVYDLSQTSSEYRRMQTTLTAIALVGNQGIIGHVGDTRAYRVRDKKIEQLTRDHSEVSELVRMQIITPEEARHHARRHIITRTVGGEPFLQPEFHNIEVEVGDVFLLCTDGLWEPLEEQEIAEIIGNYSPGDACRQLLDLAISRETSDNLSLQIVKVNAWERRAADADPSGATWLQRTLGFFGKHQKGA